MTKDLLSAKTQDVKKSSRLGTKMDLKSHVSFALQNTDSPHLVKAVIK